MATAEQCPEYLNCGYVKWRKARPDFNMAVLPENGDCGKNFETCGRLNPHTPIEVVEYGPQTRDELELAFPEIENENNRPPRRLRGGGHGY